MCLKQSVKSDATYPLLSIGNGSTLPLSTASRSQRLHIRLNIKGQSTVGGLKLAAHTFSAVYIY